MRNKNHALYFDEKIKITKRVAKFMIFIKMIAKNVSDLTGFFLFLLKETRKFFSKRARVIFGLLKRPIRPCLRLPGHHAKEDAEPAKIYAKP